MPTTLDPEKIEEELEHKKNRRWAPADPEADTDEMERVSIDDLNERTEKARREGESGE